MEGEVKIANVTRAIVDALQVGAGTDGPVTVSHITQTEKDKLLVAVDGQLYLMAVEQVDHVFFDPPVDMMGNMEGDLHEG